MQQIELLEEKVKKLIDVANNYKEETVRLKEEIESLKRVIAKHENDISSNNGFKEKLLAVEKEKEILLNEKNMVKSNIEKILQDIENII
ncbi:MAG: hypothetical protein HZA77_06875 [Candidatus Schekmanbacteria bacterium]|nr:hypothetical protein [Candidatus Schekmanbacteria bacterium]